MKKFGFVSIAASGLAAAVLGLAGPAQADLGHHSWVDQIGANVTVPHVDTSVRQSHGRSVTVPHVDTSVRQSH